MGERLPGGKTEVPEMHCGEDFGHAQKRLQCARIPSAMRPGGSTRIVIQARRKRQLGLELAESRFWATDQYQL